MKIRLKISLVFITSLVISGIIIVTGLTFVLDSLSGKMLNKQAEDIAIFLKHRIIKESENPQQEKFIQSVIFDSNIARKVAEESKGFEIRKILLINDQFLIGDQRY
jgi:hypothetical protein